MRLFQTSVLGAALLVAALAVGCSGKDDDQSNEATQTAPSPTTTAASPTAGASPTARPSATATPSGTGGGTSSSDGRDSLRRSLDKLDHATYHVVYTMTLTSIEGTYSGKFAAGAKGASNLFLMEMETEDGLFIFGTVRDAENSYFCLGGSDPDYPDEPPQASCYPGDDDDGPTDDDFPLFNFEEELQQLVLDGEVTIEDAPDRQVAGYDAKCWQVTDPTGTGVACVSKSDGFLVLIDGDFDEGHVNMEVASYTDKPQDSVFAPPYPVQLFPSDDNG